jgi:hypothetical protein
LSDLAQIGPQPDLQFARTGSQRALRF